jgi:hypothetical protein
MTTCRCVSCISVNTSDDDVVVQVEEMRAAGKS